MLDDEVLPLGNDLSKHMISEGFIDFVTFKQNNMLGVNPNESSKAQSLEPTNSIGVKTFEPTLRPITHNDQGKLMNLLHSRLLLPEDFELIDFLISRTTTSNSETRYLWFYSSGLIATTMSLALYLSKRVSLYFPAAITSAISFVCMKHCHTIYQRTCEKKAFDSAICSLQNLCLNVLRLLRILKETEILSTGQVTTKNVGAALYIPIKHQNELGRLPSWKTLPHLRKCLASTLLDMIELLKSSCNEARGLIPNWLHIEGFSISNESSLISLHITDNITEAGENICLKDLQLLNDSYLLLQSEFLRWIGFCLSPSVWNTTDSNFKSNRNQMLKLFYNTHSQLSVISFKLKMHYDIQNIFTESQQLTNQGLARSDIPVPVSGINNIQSELHNLFLIILSMLTNLKSLEDEIENSSHTSSTGLESLRETTNQQLKNVRDELVSAVNMFDTICLHLFGNNKSSPTLSKRLKDENLIGTLKPDKNLPEGSTSQSGNYMSSVDEVFLAITDFIPNEEGKVRGDREFESEPTIPLTLLAELSTTLKPIKESFKEREKAALERAGLEDINNESGSENDVVLNKIDRKYAKPKLKKKRSKLNRDNYCEGSDSSTHSLEDTVNNYPNIVQNVSILKEDSNAIVNDKLIANLVAMKSQSWKLTEEECYSDD